MVFELLFFLPVEELSQRLYDANMEDIESDANIIAKVTTLL